MPGVFEAAKAVAIIMPSSASVEKVFQRSREVFQMIWDQDMTLEDYKTLTVIVR